MMSLLLLGLHLIFSWLERRSSSLEMQ